MLNALEVVKKGGSIKSACEDMEFQGLLYKMEFWWVLGKIELGRKPGQQPYLNIEEQKSLAKFIEVVADIGFGKPRKQIKVMVRLHMRKTF